MNSTGLCYHCDNSIYENEEAVVLPTGERMHKSCAEDYLDLQAYEKAMAEHKKNPVTYTMDEVERMLEDE